MSKKNEIIGKALEYFREGFAPHIRKFLEREYQNKWVEKVFILLNRNKDFDEYQKYSFKPKFDVTNIICIITRDWDTFSSDFTNTQRSYLYEVRDVRNRWAHQEIISTQDVYRTLDTVERLLGAISCDAMYQRVKKLRHYQIIKMASALQKNSGSNYSPIPQKTQQRNENVSNRKNFNQQNRNFNPFGQQQNNDFFSNQFNTNQQQQNQQQQNSQNNTNSFGGGFDMNWGNQQNNQGGFNFSQFGGNDDDKMDIDMDF